ncbi:uncharacterized protein PHALS_13517 [Plasmopara halstedii]|uniref:Uncharacterized protein n=1 Tax=Plasmopara halstedii TaxID=4781 RepID=A0A0P1APU4_PLAHL|nr:uncharacterized protein PHALS_13517 [Plasmopara halstedii]CEG43314.1 hypothetical protein PHALS_13517 [Plasmopara halstedii]|eukprot:XP_024579683.1 hypothetical protein PHALS_13517 [Plasmopara halstedii]
MRFAPAGLRLRGCNGVAVSFAQKKKAALSESHRITADTQRVPPRNPTKTSIEYN